MTADKRRNWARIGAWTVITLIFLYDRRYLIEKAGLPHFLECVAVRVGLLAGLTTLHFTCLLPRFFHPGRYAFYFLLLALAVVTCVTLQHTYDLYLFGFIIGDTETKTYWQAFPYNLITTLWYLTIILTFYISEKWYYQRKTIYAPATEASGLDGLPPEKPPLPDGGHTDLVPREGPTTLVFKSGTQRIELAADQILFVQGLKDYSRIQTDTEKMVVYGNLKAIAGVLPAPRFVRVHKSYLVAVDKIHQITKEEIFIGAFRIPIGRTYRRNLTVV